MSTLNAFQLNAKLRELHDFSIQTRRHLHQIPELSGQEHKTTQFCQDLMREVGYQITTFAGFTGFVADLDINPDARRVAFRADMDALAMDDLTNDAYSSTHAGCAHNCGHDTHMTIALTAARYLALHREELKHNVRFVFQMAEEDMRVPGADKMVELGCMDGVDEVYALHNDASRECGTVLINAGVMSSYGSAWTLDVQGISAHGSTPEKGLDAIRETARIVMDFDYIVAKKTSPFSPAVFGCGMFHGGTIPNAVADHAQARGTIRAMDANTDQILKNSFDGIVKESTLRGFVTSMDYCGYPAVINHPDAYQRVVRAAKDIIPAELLQADCKPMTGSEDFSLMVNAAREQRGAMFFLGSGNRSKGINNYLHANPYFVDDDFMLVGAQIFIHLATH
ncbi:amidohydrolase [Deefgea piscis]|uniref:Amidohydrolase n=1 Tax=Deefgea piscis TaxID=2739061 RepID=A0A6M8SPA4_9NEIS|nr:amidohydrolase [Deefgea piscis]QKJ67073.1 amidohydrolase [Deefgea piscis]